MTRFRQLLTGLGGLTLTAGLVLGLPAALIVYLGWPLPTRLPTLEGIRLALRSGIDPRLLINTLAIIVWVTWAQLVVALTVEAAAMARGRAARRVPLLPGMQTVAARLVAAVTLVAASFGPLRPHPAALAPLATLIPAAPHHTLALDPDDTPSTEHAAEPLQPRTHVGSYSSYQVQRFDTLWSIAETTLADGQRWQEIRDLNVGRATSDGHIITSATDRIAPGTSLLLPPDAMPEDHEETGIGEEAFTEVVVQRGDHFWKIAQTVLQQAWGRKPTSAEISAYWRQLIDANRDRLRPPHDPSLIHPGQVFQLSAIPDDPTTRPSDGRSDENRSAAASEVEVQRGDSFWAIAETVLQQAWGRSPTSAEIVAYWRQLIDANRHRLPPPYDPNLIYPGQVFGLPAIPDDPTAATPDAAVDVEITPATPDTGEERAEAPIEPPPSTSAADAPPVTEAPPDITDPAASATTPPPDTVVRGDSEPFPEEAATAEEEEGGSGLLPIVATVAGLGVLAAGLVALIDRLRRLQLRHRRPDTIPTPPPLTTAQVEATLRAAAAPTAVELIDLALRALAHQVIEAHLPPPQLVGVHLDPDTLRILLWSPHHDPPEGWRVDDGGRSWTLPAAIDPTPLRLYADTTPAPYPALVTAGHKDRGQLLLDLEFAGALQITGTPADVAATCHTMATELTTSPLADTLQVICIGFGHDLAHLERIQVVDDLSEILGDIDDKIAAVAGHDGVSRLQGRVAEPGGDRWHPLIVLDPSPTPPPDANRLLAAAHQGRAVTAVVGYPTGDRWRLHVADGTVRIDPLGYTLARRNLTPTEQGGVGALIAAAKDLDGTPQTQSLVDEVMADEPAASEIKVAEGPAIATELPSGDQTLPLFGDRAEGTLEVKVLGAVRIDGFTGRFSHSKCLELITYLALHPRGADRDLLTEALWPDQSPSRKRINTIISRARLTLGTDPQGQLYLPNLPADNHYRVSPKIGCDLDRFTHLIKQADRASSDEEVARHLQAALELVEGPPFHGAGNDYAWAHTEGMATHAIVAVDNAAHRLAQHALGADNPVQATWAARQGLVATWACEECYRNLMRAAIHQDDPTALDAIYNELTTLLDADQGPDANSLLDPDTVELYEQHSRRRRQAG